MTLLILLALFLAGLAFVASVLVLFVAPAWHRRYLARHQR